MKHYLDLIQISAKHHKKQNLMTRICIVLAVFLVTVIFGMADMEMRSQLIQAIKTDGNWHAAFVMDEEQCALLKERPEVERLAAYGALNYRLKDSYQIKGSETVICGFDKKLLEMFPDTKIVEGTFPETAEEAVLTVSAQARLKIQTGDTVELTTPQGDTKQYTITGITENTALIAERDALGMFLNMDGFSALYPEETTADQEKVCYVRFRRFCNIQKTIQEIRIRFGLGEKQVFQNTKILMLMFQSKDAYIIKFYFVAAILAVLVVIAGIFMITASMNSNIIRRTEFFGMMRCLGATKKQVIRFVRREALSWCKTAIPFGVLTGILVTWTLCGVLRLLSPKLFDGLPVFGISCPGAAAGILVGFLTVFLAAASPARRAAGVSPLTAVSGNAGTVQPAKRAAHAQIFKIDTALGIHHASGSKKNFFLVTGSFAFSIILFLAFSTSIDFMHHAITPLHPSSPDLSIYREDSTVRIPAELAEEIEEYPGVKCAFGRNYAELTILPDKRTFSIISYDEQQFKLDRDSLTNGNLQDAISGKGVLSVFREENTLPLGSTITVSANGKEQEIFVTGILGNARSCIDNTTGTIICSENLFRKLTGEDGYTVLDIQLQKDATDSQVQEIRKAAERACGGSITFSDKRISNQEVRGAFYSMAVFLYGFLAVIALIAFFNIINNIDMSVSARMREYGAMRAIGMSIRQLNRMVLAEAMTYIVLGIIFGCTAGLPLNWILFRSLVTSRWGDAWSIPVQELLIIIIIMLASVYFAILEPIKQIKKMTIVDTISAE